METPQIKENSNVLLPRELVLEILEEGLKHGITSIKQSALKLIQDGLKYNRDIRNRRKAKIN